MSGPLLSAGLVLVAWANRDKGNAPTRRHICRMDDSAGMFTALCSRRCFVGSHVLMADDLDGCDCLVCARALNAGTLAGEIVAGRERAA